MQTWVIVLVAVVVVSDFGLMFWFLRRLGLFTPVKPVRENVPELWFAYRTHTGPYQNIGGVMDAVYTTLRDGCRLESARGLGVYFDNPRTTAPASLRSLGGCVLENQAAVDAVRQNTALSVGVLPESRAVTASFPYRGKMSFMVGAMRVYPALNKYLEAARDPSGPVVELYDFAKKEIRYIRPLDIPTEEMERLLGE